MNLTWNTLVPAFPTVVVVASSQLNPVGSATSASICPYVAFKFATVAGWGVPFVTLIVTSIPVIVLNAVVSAGVNVTWKTLDPTSPTEVVNGSSQLNPSGSTTSASVCPYDAPIVGTT